MTQLRFQCSGCGACCRRVSRMKGFDPDWILEDGSCMHLLEDNSCTIYEDRPLFCQVDGDWEAREDVDKVSKLEYFVLSNEKCNEFILQDGMDQQYLIDIGQYKLMDEL